MEKNFKVGDIVTCTGERGYVITSKGVKCKVTRIRDDKQCFYDMEVEVIEKNNRHYGARFDVQSKYFKKLNVEQPFTTMVNGVYCKCTPIEDKEELTRLWVNDIQNRLVHCKFHTVVEKKNTIVILSDDNWDTVKIGIARCADTDEYTFSIGEAVAAAKAMGEKIPDFV